MTRGCNGRVVVACGGILVLWCSLAAMACPPLDCGDCMYWDGDSCELTGSCASPGDCPNSGECCDCVDCKCVTQGCSPIGSCSRNCADCDCPDCWCWDVDTGITGSLSVSNACLCNTVSHVALVSDYDHFAYNGGEGWEPDTLTYSWSKAAGTNCQTGWWESKVDEIDPNNSISWQAPPCIGTVTISVTVDDLPRSASNACSGSERNDDPCTFEGTATVSLPAGCEEGTGGVNSQWLGVADPCCNSTNCGEAQIIYQAHNYKAVYNNCAWEPYFDLFTKMYAGVCYQHFQDWDCANPGIVNKDNYCSYATTFIYYDPCNPCETGCLAVSDADCIAIHEGIHVQDWSDFWDTVPGWLEDQGYLDPLPINCNDSATTTCQDAAAFFESKIDAPLYQHLGDKHAEIGNDFGGEYRAREAAHWCFHELGWDICRCAGDKGWRQQNPCPACPP